MERHGAAHSIRTTRPGAIPEQERKTRALKSSVTRTRNRVDALELEYGARDAPQSSPHYPKIANARLAATSARQAWAEHTRNA